MIATKLRSAWTPRSILGGNRIKHTLGFNDEARIEPRYNPYLVKKDAFDVKHNLTKFTDGCELDPLSPGCFVKESLSTLLYPRVLGMKSLSTVIDPARMRKLEHHKAPLNRIKTPWVYVSSNKSNDPLTEWKLIYKYSYEGKESEMIDYEVRKLDRSNLYRTTVKTPVVEKVEHGNYYKKTQPFNKVVKHTYSEHKASTPAIHDKKVLPLLVSE